MNTALQLSPPARILIADDESEIRDYLMLALRRPNLVVDFAENGEEVLNALSNGTESPALLILDVMMPRKDGISTLKEIRCRNLNLPVIMLSGVSSPSFMVEAMQSGANNFLTKPLSYQELNQAIDSLLPGVAPTPSAPRRSAPSPKPAYPVTTGRWIKSIEPLLDRLAECDVPILLQGETGVGKEVLARHIHNHSLRSGKIFLKLNCAALPSELVESELFGYERGAFTGAFRTTPGKFELANGGTILLDEIGDMDLRLQAKLLQVLQDREFHRIGAKEPTQVDVRIMAATHRDLHARILEGEFREDLYYRLNVVNLEIPPLRDRTDEIIPLAMTFLKKYTIAGLGSVPKIEPDLRFALLHHNWPGNIRELENLMRKYLVVQDGDTIIADLRRSSARMAYRVSKSIGDAQQPRVIDATPQVADRFGEFQVAPPDRTRGLLPRHTHSSRPSGSDDTSALTMLDSARKAAETELILKTLQSTQWSRKRSAVLLGIDYKAFLYKMKKLGIE